MTNWEKSCVESLITSPTAFALFKAKQKNKKHVDQYINTIWPYEIKIQGENIVRVNKKIPKNSPLNQIIEFLNDLIKKGEEGYVDREYKFEKPLTAKEIINWIRQYKYKNIVVGDSSIGNIIFCSANKRNIGIMLDTRNPNAFFRDIIDEFSGCSKNDEFTKISTDTYSERRNSTTCIHDLLKILKNFNSKSSKYKKVYLGQNVGIEIEYDGIWQKYLEKKLNRSRYAVSFNSGIDGGSTDGSKYEDYSRLRENRLRINGHRGLAALYYLVEDMKKSKCTITTRSGMHYHIDLTHVKKARPSFGIFLDVFTIKIDRHDIKTQLQQIFEASELTDPLSAFKNSFRYPTEFDTLEWRMGTPTFNFTKLTIQILCAIHVTNVLFGSKKHIDVEYITYLAEVYTKINS